MIDNLIRLVRKGFEQITDCRKPNKSYALADYLSIGFAMFSLKDPSVSAFWEQYPVRSENLKRVYKINELSGETAFRQGLDVVAPEDLQSQFLPLIDLLRKEEVLKKRQVLGTYSAVPIDGTGHYCSGAKQCPHCLVKTHKNGKKSYYHQMLGAVLIHPEQATVFPVAVEAIVKQDGSTKNDCELNAGKRLLPQIRKALPQEKVLILADALYCNEPFVRMLYKERFSFILGTKGKTYVDVQAKRLSEVGKLTTVEWETKKSRCRAVFSPKLIFSGKHQDIEVYHVEYTEWDIKTGEQLFYGTWVTDIEPTEGNIEELVAVARSRWKIENETFNTLKNQGYHFGKNYGHGKENLATNLALLTFLAFLTDQIAQHLDGTFQKAKTVCKTFRSFWEKVRSIFYLLPTLSMNAIYKFIIQRKQVKIPALE